MRQLAKVDATFFETAPRIIRCAAHVDSARTRVFSAIADDPGGWGRWFPGFDRSGRWESSEPHGVGSVRTVRAFRVRYRETVLTWDQDERWAFRVDETSAPLARAFAEDYRLSDEDGGTRLDWTIAMDPGFGMRIAGPLAQLTFQRVLNRAAKGLSRVA